MSGTVKNIDEDKLYANLEYRFQYLCDFIGLSEDDISLIHGNLLCFRYSRHPRTEGRFTGRYCDVRVYDSG